MICDKVCHFKVREQLSRPVKIARRLLRQGKTEQVRPERPQIRVWGQRVRGRWTSDGTRHIEIEEYDWQAFGKCHQSNDRPQG